MGADGGFLAIEASKIIDNWQLFKAVTIKIIEEELSCCTDYNMEDLNHVLEKAKQSKIPITDLELQKILKEIQSQCNTPYLLRPYIIFSYGNNIADSYFWEEVVKEFAFENHISLHQVETWT